VTSAQYTSPEHVMGYSDHFNVTAGYGDLATQRLNATTSSSAASKPATGRSRTRFTFPARTSDQTSSNSFPGNVDTPKGTRDPTGNPGNGYQNPICAPPLSFPTNGSPLQCRFDPAQYFDVISPSERLDLVGALTWQINPDNQFVLQGTYARNQFTFTGAPHVADDAVCQRRCGTAVGRERVSRSHPTILETDRLRCVRVRLRESLNRVAQVTQL
jgi:hypothetical protein